MNVIESGVGELFQPPDPDGFREWVHTRKNTKMVDKVMTEQEAVAKFVADGDYIGTELYGTVRAPMSLVREIAANAPLTIRATKEMTRRILAARRPAGSDMDLVEMCYMSADFNEGVTAFLAKRRPQWTGT